MKRAAYILTFLFLYAASFCQDGFLIKGMISDSSTLEAVEGAGIQIAGTANVSLSDTDGNFSIKTKTLPVTLLFSHLCYQERSITIGPSENLFFMIRLSKKTKLLPSLTVKTEKPVNITGNQAVFITDYEFSGNNILVLAYNYKLNSKIFLSLLNENGDTLCSTRLKEQGKLFRDCFNKDHFITPATAWQVLADSASIDLVYPEDLEVFEEQILPVLAELNGKYFFGKHYYHDQLLQYYYYDKKTAKAEEMRVIMDESKLFMLRDRGRIINGADDPEMQERFEDMAFYRPVYAPMIKLHDTICIFNFTDSILEFYSDSSKLIKEIPISFHNNKFWKREIFVDDATGKVYTLFRKNGISTIREINMKSGELANSTVIPELPYIDKIKINNHAIYFLYTEHSDLADYKKLYKMRI
jgi:hypothetical protein